jgi:hypothetical protein
MATDTPLGARGEVLDGPTGTAKLEQRRARREWNRAGLFVGCLGRLCDVWLLLCLVRRFVG